MFWSKININTYIAYYIFRLNYTMLRKYFFFLYIFISIYRSSFFFSFELISRAPSTSKAIALRWAGTINHGEELYRNRSSHSALSMALSPLWFRTPRKSRHPDETPKATIMTE